MAKVNNIPDQDGCIDEEIARGIYWQKDEDSNALFQDVDGGYRKIAEFPEDFSIARVENIRDGKAFFIEGEQGRKLALVKAINNQYYAVGNAAQTDERGRVKLSKSRNTGATFSPKTFTRQFNNSL